MADLQALYAANDVARAAPPLADAQVTIRIVHHPEPHAVPCVRFPDGRVSSTWEDFHAVRRLQRPELYGSVREQVA